MSFGHNGLCWWTGELHSSWNVKKGSFMDHNWNDLRLNEDSKHKSVTWNMEQSLTFSTSALRCAKRGTETKVWTTPCLVGTVRKSPVSFCSICEKIMLQNQAVILEDIVFFFFTDILLTKVFLSRTCEAAYGGASSFTFNRFQHGAKEH